MVVRDGRFRHLHAVMSRTAMKQGRRRNALQRQREQQQPHQGEAKAGTHAQSVARPGRYGAWQGHWAAPNTATSIRAKLRSTTPSATPLDLPRQGRLRRSVAQAILAGHLSLGAALPSSCELAVLPGLSCNTVTSARPQLMDDGFREARPCSVVFVAPNARPPSAAQAGPPAGASGLPGQPPDWPARVPRSLVGQPTLAKPEQ